MEYVRCNECRSAMKIEIYFSNPILPLGSLRPMFCPCCGKLTNIMIDELNLDDIPKEFNEWEDMKERQSRTKAEIEMDDKAEKAWQEIKADRIMYEMKFGKIE